MTGTTNKRTPRKLTAKGVRTRTALLASAREVFEEKGYFATSVSEIGRRCGVSQGTFYQYFNNKEQIFRELTDTIISEFWDKAAQSRADENKFADQLRQNIQLLFEHARLNADFHLVLNEFELIDIVTNSYYDSMARYYRNFFRSAINLGLIRPIDPNVIAYSLIGVALFRQMDWGKKRKNNSMDEAVEMALTLLLKGVSGPAAWNRPEHLSVSAFPENEDSGIQWEDGDNSGSQTRRSIYQAAEAVIGQLGYHGANVSEITRRAGVAQGTFYIHFESKEDLMSGVVRYLSREMRRQLKQITNKVSDRRDQEREGMLAYFRFLKQHSQIYRVVAESETIGKDVALWYYRKLAAGYIDQVKPAVKNGQIIDLPVDFIVHYLMGLNHMLGLKWLVWNSSPNAEVSAQILEDTIELALFGLSPEK